MFASISAEPPASPFLTPWRRGCLNFPSSWSLTIFISLSARPFSTSPSLLHPLGYVYIYVLGIAVICLPVQFAPFLVVWCIQEWYVMYDVLPGMSRSGPMISCYLNRRREHFCGKVASEHSTNDIHPKSYPLVPIAPWSPFAQLRGQEPSGPHEQGVCLLPQGPGLCGFS